MNGSGQKCQIQIQLKNKMGEPPTLNYWLGWWVGPGIATLPLTDSPYILKICMEIHGFSCNPRLLWPSLTWRGIVTRYPPHHAWVMYANPSQNSQNKMAHQALQHRMKMKQHFRTCTSHESCMWDFERSVNGQVRWSKVLILSDRI